jgi:hypothetical protein
VIKITKETMVSKLLVFCLVLLVGSVFGTVHASDDPVYVLPELSYEAGVFDNALSLGRLTAGNPEQSEYRVVTVPLDTGLNPMMAMPQSEQLDSLLSTVAQARRVDGAAFQAGDVELVFALDDSSYALALRFNTETELGGVVIHPYALLAVDGSGSHVAQPIVRDLPVTILRVDDEMLEKMGDDIATGDLPQVGEYIMAHVSFSNDNYRIISVATISSSFVWIDIFSSRDATEIYGQLSDYVGTVERPISVSIPASYTVRPFALLSLEERTQAWLDGAIEWVEPNCFTLEGECYRQGYNGESYGPGPFQLLIGTFLGATNIDDHFVLYIGFTAQNGERYFVPFNAGNYEVPNGFGVVIYDTPAIGQPGDMGVIVPWREGVGIDTALTSFAGSPTDIALLTGSITASEAEFGQYIDTLGEADATSSADVASRFIFDVTVRGQSIDGGPSYINSIVNGESLGELPMIASMTFGRYI